MAKKLESAFQNDTVIKAIKQRIPDTLILKNDPTYLQDKAQGYKPGKPLYEL